MGRPFSTLMVEHKDLFIERFYSSVRIQDPDISGISAELLMDRVLSEMAYQLTAVMRVPAEIVQDKEVARWPDGWVQAVKWAVRGWWPGKLRVRFRTLKLREVLLYPTVRVPSEYADHVRLAWVTSEGLAVSE